MQKQLTRWLAILAAALLFAGGCSVADGPDDELGTHESELSPRDSDGDRIFATPQFGMVTSCAAGSQRPGCAATGDFDWEVLFESTAGYPLTDVWGTSTDDVIVVGWQSPIRPNRGRILHFDGTAWDEDNTGPRATLTGVSGNVTSAFVVGTDGTIARRTGAVWQPMPSPTQSDLNDVFVEQGNIAWAVGDNGTVLKLQGQTWKEIDSGTSSDLNGIWGTNGTAIVIGDDGTTAIVGDGRVVRTLNSQTYSNLNGIWGTNGTAIVIGDDGYGAFIDSGSMRAIPLGVDTNLRGIWGTNGTAIVVGDHGKMIEIHMGTFDWSPGPELTDEDLISVWGDGVGSVYVVGDQGTVLRGKKATP